MNYISLADALSSELIALYTGGVCGLSCRVYGIALEPELESGSDPAALPDLTKELAARLTQDLEEIRLPGAIAAPLQSEEGELVGFVIVGAPNETELGAARFLVRLLNELIAAQTSRESLEFDSAYSRKLFDELQQVALKIARVFDIDEAASIMADECEAIFGATTVAVLEKNEALPGGMGVVASCGPEFTSFDAARSVCESGKFLICDDVASDSRFAKGLNLRNLMIVPMSGSEGPVGALALGNKGAGGADFTLDDQRLAGTLGALLGSTMANIKLHGALLGNERIRANLERYLSPNLVAEVIAKGGIQTLGGERVDATMLFSDLRGFTRLSESVSPEVMVAQLNEYFEEMTEVIFNQDGTLDKFVGDLIFAVFGVPKAMPDAHLRAVRTAIAMQQRLTSLNQRWLEQGRLQFHAGIGINAGGVVFGNIGSSRAMGMTVIGDHVNTAQRLEAAARQGEILISEPIAKSIEGIFRTTLLGPIEVKGKKIVAYRVDYL